MKCSITFLEAHCVFQDLFMGAKIGLGIERGGFYYLEINWQDLDRQANQVLGKPTLEERIWL